MTAPPPSIPPRPADLPSQEDAKAAALALLERAGVATRGASVTVDDGVTQWFVNVDPVVDGVATEGFGSSVSVGPKSEIEYAGGVLGDVAAADDYPLVGTTTAIDRLNNGFGLVGPRPLGAEGGAESDAVSTPGVNSAGSVGFASGSPASGAPTEPDEPPAAPIPEPSSTLDTPSTPVTDRVPAPPTQTFTLVRAERILLFATSADANESWLVPAYRFTTADGPGPSVIAVDDRFLTPPDALQPAVKSAEVPAVASDGGR